jgi:hypothetical protein
MGRVRGNGGSLGEWGEFGEWGELGGMGRVWVSKGEWNG